MQSSVTTPLFPLSSIVLPGGLLPLRLFEPRYINMVKDCFKTESGFGVCLIKDGQEAGQVAEPYPRGTLVSIIDFDQGPDGLLHITAKGEQEFTLNSFTTKEDNLLIGDITPIPTQEPLEMSEEYRSLSQKLAIILQYVEPNIIYPEKELSNPDWVCHRMLELLPLSATSKFELLELNSNQERLSALLDLNIEFANS